MKFTRHSVSTEMNIKEFLRLLSRAELRGEDLVVEQADFPVLTKSLESLLDSYHETPYIHAEA